MITVEIRLEGLERKFNTLAEKASDLGPALRAFGGYVAKRAKERIKEQNFAPLAQSSIEGRIKKGRAALHGKLLRDVKKAIYRSKSGPLGELVLQSEVNHILNRFLSDHAYDFSGESKGIQNRIKVLSEFQRRHSKSGSGFSKHAGLTPLSFKQLASLSGRE